MQQDSVGNILLKKTENMHETSTCNSYVSSVHKPTLNVTGF